MHPVTAQVLTQRGMRTPEEARQFLRPGPDQLHDAFLFRDMERAIAILLDAIKRGERIAVYGDYDVDGVTATTVLMRTLRFLDADVIAFIPERLREGYGLSADALMRLHAEGCRVVVTVDNGTTRPDEIAAAREAGLEVIVTDHHEPGPQLPDCPLVNPKRADTRYPFAALAGCGVAFKLAVALVERSGRMQSDTFKRLLPDLIAVVALGTVADVMPLVDENRSLVSLGLKALKATRHEGLRALLEVSRCTRKPLVPSDVSFRIGPRINAAGRLGSASLALDLLLCEEPERAAELAEQLDEGNRERQKIQREQWNDARVRAEKQVAESDRSSVVLADSGWHPGVIGIVAARTTEAFDRPAALISIEGDRARGSARSFGHVQLHQALAACDDLLLTHGGHAAAAGFTLESSKIEAFAEAFDAAVRDQGDAADQPREVDAELPLDAVSAALAAELELLAPFGNGNREPVFCAFGVKTAGKIRRVGAQESHLSFYAASERSSVRAIGFNQAGKHDLLAGRFDLSFVVRRRDGQDPVEIVVRDIVACPNPDEAPITM